MPENRITATRYHDFSMGHRVCGHKHIDANGRETTIDGPCARIHGHNYRIFFTVEASGLDEIGRVLDFTCIKALLCQWLEQHWDHRFIVWERDPMRAALLAADPQGVVEVPFNPTAENIGVYLVDVVGPGVLQGTGTELVRVVVEETRKCSAEVSKSRR